MMFVLERVSDPDIEPIELPEMKRHLRAYDDVTDDDDDITALIQGGREWVEHYTGRALIDQTWRLTIELSKKYSSEGVTYYERRPGYYTGPFQLEKVGELLLRRSPVLALSSFVSVDSAGTETAVDADTYALREPDSKWPRIVGLNGIAWTSGTYRITFRAGFADRDSSPQQNASDVPVRYKQAIKLWVEANYNGDYDLLKVAESLIYAERSNLSIA